MRPEAELGEIPLAGLICTQVEVVLSEDSKVKWPTYIQGT